MSAPRRARHGLLPVMRAIFAGMVKRVNRGMRQIGGWPFWIGFWLATLGRNVRKQRRPRNVRHARRH